MMGGGNKRDERSFTVSNTNVFAALDSLRKKKKSEKEKGSSKDGKIRSKAASGESKQVYWTPAPLTSKSWADVDDEDDDDYYATTAPPQMIWGGPNNSEKARKPDPIVESESEDDLLDEGYEDVEEEHDDHGTEEVQEQPRILLKNPVEGSLARKEAERQLSKKEIRKKELAELEAILADFGVDTKDKSEDEPSGTTKEDNNPLAESKSAKKKKKKDKASKEPRDQPYNSDSPNRTRSEAVGSEPADVKEKLKKMASLKKKKSNKEMDAAGRAAASEAAARSARLAAAKKKEKNHYNQHPMR